MTGLPPFIIFCYIIGIAFGVGGSTIGGMLFLRTLRNRKIDSTAFSFFEIICNLSWFGLFVAASAGVGVLAAARFGGAGTITIRQPQFFLSAFAALVILVDGIIMRAKVMPLVARLINKPLTSARARKNLSLLATGGAVLLVSWYALPALAIWSTAQVSFAALFWLYIAVVLASVFFAHEMEKFAHNS